MGTKGSEDNELCETRTLKCDILRKLSVALLCLNVYVFDILRRYLKYEWTWRMVVMLMMCEQYKYRDSTGNCRREPLWCCFILNAL